jgi:hypothetical protein
MAQNYRKWVSKREKNLSFGISIEFFLKNQNYDWLGSILFIFLVENIYATILILN